MTELKILLENNRYEIYAQDFYLEFPAGSEGNKKALILFLRGFKKEAEAKRPLFSLKQIAEAVPDFKGRSRQSVQDHERRFKESGEDLQKYLNRKRKVEGKVIHAVLEELKEDCLGTKTYLAKRVNQRLGRDDVSDANIEAALEQISAKIFREIVKKQMNKGEISYKEEFLLETLLETVNKDAKAKKVVIQNLYELSGIEQIEEKGMQVVKPDSETICGLLSPNKDVSSIPLSVRWVVFSLLLYGYGVPLSIMSKWFKVNKTTVLRWIVGLSTELWHEIRQWICQEVKGHLVYLDEKWIKIKGKWHYWFVALDGETLLPIVERLMIMQTRLSCLWVVLQLKRIGLHVKVFVTDGLKGYFWAVSKVFPHAIHQLCLFHHQKNVTKFVKDHIPDNNEREKTKKAMKKVFQTKDKRTVKNRLKKLETSAEKLGFTGWIKEVFKMLVHLIPAVGSRRIPTTNNAIERFFKAFNRFYKVRRGFFSYESAKQQMIIFLVFYVFTQGEAGTAPIEKIIPQAKFMPLYQLMNNPITWLSVEDTNVKIFIKLDKYRALAQTKAEKAA